MNRKSAFPPHNRNFFSHPPQASNRDQREADRPMAGAFYAFDDEDMVIEEGIGYPRAYAKLCRDRSCVGVYAVGPPFAFTPSPPRPNEISRAKQLEQVFPVIDPKARPTTKPKIYAGLLWKQLNHLGNAGFDPAVIRIDPYGNVLYFHADKASPLAWEIDHWFPCSRGGLTVPSNLRIIQWQVCKRKHNNLEFIVPWWDFQLGISVNQFLSIFASSNSDYRRRGFSFLFSEGESEELHDSQAVQSHSFPQHFLESREQLGLAAAAVVASRKDPFDSSLALRSLDYNSQSRSNSPAIAGRKGKSGDMKENEDPDFATNPYQAIAMARYSLKRNETREMQSEIQKLDGEVYEFCRRNDEEKVTIQDLELQLNKRRKRAEKCRRLAEAQASYKTILEKMIRDAMHQSVVYKEQVRLNQAAASALTARLNAQRAICDVSEKELHKKFKQRDEIEAQIRHTLEEGRKRSRMDETVFEDINERSMLYLPGIKPTTPLHREPRVYLDDEQKASEAQTSEYKERNFEAIGELKMPAEDCKKEEAAYVSAETRSEKKLQELEIGEEKNRFQFPLGSQRQEAEEDEEIRKERGKGNVERWLQMLLENSREDEEPESLSDREKSNIIISDEILTKLDQKFPHKEVKGPSHPGYAEEHMTLVHQEIVPEKVQEIVEVEVDKTAWDTGSISRNSGPGFGSSRKFEVKERKESRKEQGLKRSESAKTLRRTPSSPLIIGMKKGVECMIKKPVVMGDDDYEEDHHPARNSFIKSIRKAVKK